MELKISLRYILLIGIFGFLIFLSHFAWFVYHPISLNQISYYQLKKGRPSVGVAWDLYRLGFFKARWEVHYFLCLMQLYHANARLRAGEYELSSQLTPLELLQHFIEGKVVYWNFKIKEGWRWEDLNIELLTSNLLQEKVVSQDQVFRYCGLPSPNLEGVFFPDTYWIERHTPALELLQRASLRMKKVLTEEWQQRALDLPYQTPYEALIAASLIEKETGIEVERTQIAGVIVRRLKLGMRLQMDPSVRYGMGEEGKGALFYSHLQQDTPYNTYTRSGLPPTPIAYPGRASIHAALHPDNGDALYFVALGDASGRHVFSKTFDEHKLRIRERLLVPKIVIPPIQSP